MDAAQEKVFYVRAESTGQERRLREKQCTVHILSTIFDLSQDRMYLSDGTHVEFPDSEGVFCTDSFENLDSLKVHAPGSTNQSSDSHQAVPPANSQVGSASTPTAGVLGSTPGFSGFKTPNHQRWVPSALSKGKGKGCVTCIKVTLAARKPDGSAGVQKSQCFLNLTNNNANVPVITRMIRDHFHDNSLILSSPNGLPIPDSSATSGLGYWKVGSRKLFALHPASRRRQTPTINLNDDDDDDDECDSLDFDTFPPPSKRRSTRHTAKAFEDSLKQLKDMASEHRFADDSVTVSEATPVPLPILNMLKVSFKCVVCQDVITPPVTYGACCQSILGCERCLDTWYKRDGPDSLLTSKCPHCQAPRGFSKAQRLRGLDDFLQHVRTLVTPTTQLPGNSSVCGDSLSLDETA